MRSRALSPPELVKGDSQTGGFRQSQHDIEILHRSAASALAQIVERRHDPRLLRLFISKNIECQAVGACQDFGVQCLGGGGVLQALSAAAETAGAVIRTEAFTRRVKAKSG